MATRRYNVTHNGYKTVMNLNDEDVKLYPDAELVEDQAAAEGDEQAEDAKKRTAPNKARGAANK